MSDQIDLFPVESLPDQTPPPLSLTAPPEVVKDPGCFIVRARWRTFHWTTQPMEFATLAAAEIYAAEMHVGWNNRKIYHLGEK